MPRRILQLFEFVTLSPRGRASPRCMVEPAEWRAGNASRRLRRASARRRRERTQTSAAGFKSPGMYRVQTPASRCRDRSLACAARVVAPGLGELAAARQRNNLAPQPPDKARRLRKAADAVGDGPARERTPRGPRRQRNHHEGGQTPHQGAQRSRTPCGAGSAQGFPVRAHGAASLKYRPDRPLKQAARHPPTPNPPTPHPPTPNPVPRPPVLTQRTRPPPSTWRTNQPPRKPAGHGAQSWASAE